MNHVTENVDPAMTSGLFFVLFRLADRGSDHSGEDWTCYPSVDQIATDTHLSRSAVERHLQTLVAEGWISRKRRVRSDGRKGIYDFWIHRDGDRRSALKAARTSIVAAGGKLAEDLGDLDHPDSKTPHRPCGDLGPDHAAICAGPCGDLLSLEPKEEPSKEPTRRAREPGDAGFEDVVAIWPESGRKRTVWPKGRAAWAWACSVEDVGRLVEAVAACAADPAMAKGDHGWPGLHTWLTAERWRAYLPAEGQAVAEAAAVMPRFAVEAIRAAVVAVRGEDFAGSYLDPASWDGEAVIPRNGYAHGKLAERDVAAAIEAAGGALARPVAKLNEGQAA